MTPTDCINCGHEELCHENDITTTGTHSNCNAVLARNVTCACHRYQAPAPIEHHSKAFVQYFNKHNIKIK